MISVENFYWVLYENLLKPCDLSVWYYYPFGTMENLSCFEYHPYLGRYNIHHAFFHFDQEPLYDSNLGSYDLHGFHRWSNKFCRIFANSERSEFKRKFLRENKFGDWYYFYHGFAALDWFSDAKFISDPIRPVKVFNCVSHLVRSFRNYRMLFTAKLISKNLLPFGDVSLHATKKDIINELNDPNSLLTIIDQQLIQSHLLDQVPMTSDCKNIDSSFSANFGFSELKFWQRSLWHVVNETVFYPQKLHLTEKTFKPIVAMRPFMLVAAPGNLKYLRSYGFRTFGDWIDESYDEESDSTARLDKIVGEIAKLCNLSWVQLMEMYQDMLPILEHNKKHFFGEFRHIIVNELVDNFDQCIRIWNNGRVDGHELPLHPDLNQVKKILLS
jgi:hypothetical protein